MEGLQFQDIVYRVPDRRWPLKRKGKLILDGLSGEFRRGELTAIVGPSGAGKSSLLNILAGYTGGYSGTVVRGVSRYIMQEDHLCPWLTAGETLRLAAELKVRGRRGERVRAVEDSLGLGKVAGTLVGRLSGGEQKRLSIALELLSDPPFLFLDEPTTGLDSSTGRDTTALLSKLAAQGRAVVCTLHQPSASILGLVDHLYSLVEGRCAFSGHPSSLPAFFSSLGLPCPPYHNPVDHLIELTFLGGHNLSLLLRNSSNGKATEWRKSPPPPAPTTSLFSFRPPSALRQVSVLVRKSALTICRDKFLLHLRVLAHVLTGLLIGGFYLNIGSDAAYIMDNFSFLFFNLLFLVFSALSAMIISFPNEIKIIKREVFNKWYSVGAYFVANCLSEVPVQCLCSILYSVIVYLMSGQPRDPSRMGQFVGLCVVASLMAQSMGYMIGALMNVQNGVIFGPLSIMPSVVLSGYFLLMKDSPSWLHCLFQVSYLRYGLEGLLITVYGYGRATIPCSADYCHFRSPARFLRELEMEQVNFWHNLLVLGLFMVLSKLATYLLLRLRLYRNRKPWSLGQDRIAPTSRSSAS